MTRKSKPKKQKPVNIACIADAAIEGALLAQKIIDKADTRGYHKDDMAGYSIKIEDSRKLLPPVTMK